MRRPAYQIMQWKIGQSNMCSSTSSSVFNYSLLCLPAVSGNSKKHFLNFSGVHYITPHLICVAFPDKHRYDLRHKLVSFRNYFQGSKIKISSKNSNSVGSFSTIKKNKIFGIKLNSRLIKIPATHIRTKSQTERSEQRHELRFAPHCVDGSAKRHDWISRPRWRRCVDAT